MSEAIGYDDLNVAATTAGLVCRGGFHPVAADEVPDFADGVAVATLVLFGFIGPMQWPAFAASAESRDGQPNPLDRWSKRRIDAIGRRYSAVGLYPMEGPPWWPFQRWAMRSEPVHSSPLGILIHPRYGLWHAYRGALAFRTRIDLPVWDPTPSPCDQCAAKPCLTTCPVAAMSPGHYAQDVCAKHVVSDNGQECLRRGCLARRACPVGVEHRYTDAQSEFHMAQFAASQT